MCVWLWSQPSFSLSDQLQTLIFSISNFDLNNQVLDKLSKFDSNNQTWILNIIVLECMLVHNVQILLKQLEGDGVVGAPPGGR
jgi:hypothetical protein